MVTIELNPTVPADEWRAYVEAHPEGSIYHLPQWREVLAESFHHQPFYFFARNGEGKLSGILPLFQVKSWLTGNRLVSLPFSYICGPIADSDTVLNELVSAAEKLSDKLKCRYLEIRMMRPAPLNLEVSNYFSTYVLNLADSQEVWKKLHQKGVRWAVGKAKKDGVTVKLDNTADGVKIFNNLNQMTKKNLGVPAHPLYFLNNIARKLPDCSKLYLAYVNEKPIAGIVTISFKDTVCYAYGASDSNYLSYHPNDLAIWRTIEESCEKGYHYFDFGKTAPDNEGLIRFKKHWGTEPKTMYYYYYPKIPNLISANRGGMMYKFVTGLWKRLPISLTRPLGSLAFKHLD